MRPNLATHNRICGFTLIELMVVVAIIAIVSAAVVPAFSSTMHRNRQREAAMLIVGSVFAARSRAARTGRCYRVRVRLSPPANAGGFGGAVAVDESLYSSCVTALNPTPPLPGGPPPPPPWRRVSYKSVWTSTEVATDIQADARGDSHAGLVGEDVAIQRITDRAGNVIIVGDMHFEPTGWLGDGAPRWFDITGGPVTRQVQVTAGGAVRYTLRPAP